MSTMQFEYPRLDWAAGDLYQEWQRFQQHVSFVFRGPLAKADNKTKAGWIGLWIGQEGREVYKTLNFENDDEDKPEKILEKLENYVRPKKNKRMARFKLHQRTQNESETFDNFVKDLKILAMDCDYADRDDVLIDLIISGVRHKKVQERLLEQGQDVTLNKAIEIGQQFELSQAQVKFMRGEEVMKVTHVNKFKGHDQNRKVDTTTNIRTTGHRSTNHGANRNHGVNHNHGINRNVRAGNRHTGTTCKNCGTQHKQGSCPAWGTRCNYCKKLDHWKKMCHKRLKVNSVHVDSESDSDTEVQRDDSFITVGTVANDNSAYSQYSVNSVQDDKWVAPLNIANQTVLCRIDTGAKTSILTVNQFRNLKGCKLQKSTRTLKSFSNHKITSVGCVELPVKYGKRKTCVHFEVVDLQQENIISGNTALELGLIEVPLGLQQHTDVLSVSNEQSELSRDFPELEKTTGTLPGEYSLSINESAQGVIHPVRKLPAAVKPRAIEKLQEMETNGYITKVDKPTEWVSSMVVSLKGDKVRICIDPRDLNEAIKREHHPMRTIEEVITDIPSAKIFSVLDAKSGFLQIKLDEKSSYLTTFNTPIGRYRWLRLPFGIKSAPEIYQKIMDNMIAGIKGVFAIVDDILIAADTLEEHDKILKQVVERATRYNLKLNFDKCKIRKSSVAYMGHVITDQGLKADPEKVKAIMDMPAPQDKEGIRRFLGLVQYLSKFIPNLSELDAPLRILLKSDIEFQWNPEQIQSFKRLKTVCSQPPVLALFDVNKPVEIECDASKDGLGAVLLQEGQAVAYASRALTETEKRYAQIEKETLAIVYSCQKFHNYIFGKEVKIYSDHKPLEIIFKKPLLAAPMRIQRMMIKLQWYDIQIIYRKGKLMYISDTLSRAYLQDTHEEESEKLDMIGMLSITSDKYTEIQVATATELDVLMKTIQSGWSDTRSETPFEARSYFDSRDQLSVLDSIIYKGSRIVIPPSMRKEMLTLIHKSHLGIVKSKSRAREVMYWPCMNTDIEQTVNSCSKCAEYQKKQTSEPLQPTPAPDLPYSHVGSDIFEFNCKKYLILVDYYSKYIDAVELRSENTTDIIHAMKTVFACHGVPSILRSDNGPQYSSALFKDFCTANGIKHERSSPHFQSSNGEAERAVQTVKHLWMKCDDKQFALLDYRTTPLENLNLSPAQLLMGRRPRNSLPASQELLKPIAHDTNKVKQQINIQRRKQKFYYDSRKGVKELPPLQDSTAIRMKTPGTKSLSPGFVVNKMEKPRSYLVKSNGRLYRRNRVHLHKTGETICDNQEPQFDETLRSENYQIPEPPKENKQTVSVQEPTRTRSGRVVVKPDRLDM